MRQAPDTWCIGAAAILLGFTAALIALGVACSGGARAKAIEPAGGEYLPWCFDFEGKHNDVWQAGQVCFEHEQTCKDARASALRWGGLGGVEHVGACTEF